MSDEDRARIGAGVSTQSYAKGTQIIKEGEPGVYFYIVKSGTVLVTRHNSETNEDEEVVHLSENDYFGEAALLTDAPRTASVIALEDVVCYSLSQKRFKLLLNDPEKQELVVFPKRQAISAEDCDDSHSHPHGSVSGRFTEKTEEQMKLLLAAMRKNVVFSTYEESQLEQVASSMWIQEVASGETLIEVGESGNFVYVVEQGEFEIIKPPSRGNVAKKPIVAGAGEVFGELALLYNAPRNATVKAIANSQVWVTDRVTFRNILIALTDDVVQEYASLIEKIPVLACLAKEERESIARCMQKVSFAPSVNIIKQGDPGDELFILIKGSAVAMRREVEGGPNVEVRQYGPGGFFGERALIMNEPRAATVTALSDCDCLRMKRYEFELMMGSLEDVMNSRINEYSQINGYVRQQTLAKSQVSSLNGMQNSVNIRTRVGETMVVNSPLALSKRVDFETVVFMGRGSFGNVSLVKHKASKKFYAMKALNKAHIVEKHQKTHVRNEKLIMQTLDHPNIIRL